MKTETLAERTKRVLDKTASIDAREQAIIDRHTSTAPSDGLASRTAKAMAQLEIESRRQQRSYAEQAPTETVEPVKEMLSNIGDRAAMLAAVRKLTPEQRAEALKLKPGVAQIMGDDRGGAGNRTLGAVSRGISGVSQPIQELVSGIAEQPIVKSLGGLVAGRAISQPATEMLGNVSGTAEEIEFIRQFEAASQEFAPARPDDPWYARGPLQATEMAPWMVTTVGGAGLGRAAATGVAGRIAARGAAGGKIAQGVAKAGQAVGKVITAGKAGELTGITAAAFPSQYAQEVDQLKAIGMEDGTQLRLLAGATSAVIGLWEGIVPNPYGAKVPLKEGAVKAARQYLWEAAKRAPGELSEEYLQGVTSGLGEHVAQYIDENAEDKTVADAFRKGWEQTKEAALPMAFLLGVPAVGGAGRAALQARATQPPVGTPPTEQAPPTDVNTRGEQPLAVQAVMQSFIDGAMQKLATLDKPPGAHKWAEIVLGDRKRFKEAPDEATRTKLWQQSRGTATEAPTPPTLPPSLPQGATDVSQVPTNEEEVQGQARIQGEQETRVQGSEQQATQENAGTEVPVESKKGSQRGVMAVMTSDGKVYSDPGSTMHSDVVEKFGLDSYDIIDGGFIIDGKYKMAMSDGGYAATEGEDEQVATVKRYADEYNAKVTPATSTAPQTEATTAPTKKPVDPVSELDQAEDELAGLLGETTGEDEQASGDVQELPQPKHPDEVDALPKDSLYRTTAGGKKFIAVRGEGKRGGGDRLFETVEAANAHIERQKIIDQQNEEVRKKREEREAAESKQEADYVASFQGFKQDNPREFGRARKVLDTQRNYRDKVQTRKQIIEQSVADGAKVLDGRLERPDGTSLGEDAITKIGIQYAEHLIAARLRSDAAKADLRGDSEMSEALNRQADKLSNPESKWQSETRAKLEAVPALKGAKIEADEKTGKVKVTRPDGLKTTIHFNSDEELAAAAIKKGRKPELVHGWHVVKDGESNIYIRTDANHTNILNHEVMHWLQSSGVVTKEEIDQHGGIEKMANDYGKWAELKLRKKDSVFQKVYDALESLFSAQKRFFEEVGKRQAPQENLSKDKKSSGPAAETTQPSADQVNVDSGEESKVKPDFKQNDKVEVTYYGRVLKGRVYSVQGSEPGTVLVELDNRVGDPQEYLVEQVKVVSKADAGKPELAPDTARIQAERDSKEKAKTEKKQRVAPEGYALLPEKTRTKFEAAWDGTDQQAMKDLLGIQNKALRAEFERRSDSKLPRTVKGTEEVVDQVYAARETKPAENASQEKIAQLPWSNSSPEDESKWHGTKVNVAPANRREEPYSGKVVRVLNSGDMVEVQPDGQDGTFRVDSARITLAEESPTVTDEPSVEPAAEPLPEPAIPVFTRTTPDKGSTTRQDQADRVEKARSEIADLERKRRAKQGEHDKLRSNATKKRAAVRKDIEFLNRRIKVVQGEIAFDMASDTTAKLEDELESPRSYDHYLAGMRGIHRLKAGVAEEAEQRGEMGRDAARTVVSKEEKEADRLDAELQVRAKDIAMSKGFISGDADQIALSASNGFTIFEDRSLADVVEVHGKRTRESRVSQEINKLKPESSYGRKQDLSAEQIEEFTKQYQEASKDDKNWLAKRLVVDTAVKDAIDESREAVRKREDEERKEKEAEKAKNEQEALENARERAKKYFLGERISKALKKQKPKTKPVMVRVEEGTGKRKIVEGKITEADQNGELYPNGLILHKSFDEDSGNDFAITHAGSGLGFPFIAKKSAMQELIGLIDLLGLDFNVATDEKGALPSELTSRMKKINTAWDNGDYSTLSEQDYATVEALGQVAKTDIDADLILTADDLGANGIPPGLESVFTDRGLRVVKGMAAEVPEFAYDPVFTVKDGMLLYRDGYEFNIDPTAFNLHPSELKEGQTVGINLEDFGIKRATPQDVVAQVMKGTGIPRVTKNKGGDVSVGYVGAIPTSLQQGKDDNEWDVVGGTTKVREIAIAALKKIRWRQPGQDGDPKTDIDIVPAEKEQAAGESAVGTSRDELRAKYKEAESQFDNELTDFTKSLSSQKARTKNRSKIAELEDKYKTGKDDIQKRREAVLQPLMQEIINHPDTIADRAKAGETAKVRREEQDKVFAEQKEATEAQDWEKVQEAGGYEAVKSDLEDKLKGIQSRLDRTKESNKWKLTGSVGNTQSQIDYLESLNEKFGTEPSEEVANEAEPVAPTPVVQSPVEADFMEMSNGVNAPGVNKTIRVTAGERTLLMERSKHDGEWSIKEVEKYTGEFKGKTPVKTKGAVLASGIIETKKAKEIAQRIIDGTFDNDSDKRFVREDTQNIGLTNAGIAESMKGSLGGKRDSFAKLLREQGLVTDGRILMKVNDKDRDAILKGVGETFEGRSLSVVAQMMTDGQKALSRSANAMKPIGYRGGYLTPRTVVLQSQDGDSAIIDKVLHDTILKKYPNAVPYFLEDGKPISYAIDGDLVAIVMPMNMDKPDAKVKDLVAGKYDFEAEAAEAAKFPPVTPKTKLKKAAEKANKELSDAVDEFGNAIKGTAFSNIPLTPEVLAAAAKVVSKAIEAGVRNFAELMERMVTKYGDKMAERMRGAIQQAWDQQAPKAIPEMKQPELIPEATEQLENPETDDDTTSTKHAKTDELRAKRGFPERVPPEPETFQEWEDEARRKYPGAADRLRVIDLAEQHPERVGKIENAAIGQHIVYLENLHKSGEDVLDELLRTIKVANVVGSEAGRALVSRKAERFSDFSLAGIVNQHIGTVGKDPTDEQMQKYAELADKVAKLEGERDALQEKLSQAAVDKAIAEAAAAKNPPPPKQGTKKATLLKKASAAVAAFKAEWATLSQLGAVNDPRQQADKWIKITKAAGEVIKSYAELGVESFLELISSVKRDMGQLDQYQVDAFKEAWGTHKKATKSEPLGENPKDAAIGALARDLTRWAVESGIEGREEVIDAVHQELQDMGLDISRSDTMAAMSGYGDFRELSKDEVSVKVRGIKGEIQQLLKLEDMQAGQAPMKTGVERREPTDEERQLIKQVNEAKKRGGYEVTDPDRQLKSALGTAKTAIRNRIADLEQEIQSREKIVKERTPLKEDGELLSLREKRDELLKEHRKIFPPKNSGLTDAQRLKMAEALLDRQIAELTADLAAGRLEPKDKRAQVTSTALDAKKAAKKALIEARDSAREASPEYQAKLEAKRTAQYKKTLEKQLAFWQSRRDEASKGNLPEKRKPTTPVDNEILEKKWQIELVKREASAEIEHAERAARGPAQKALGFGGDLLDFARAIQTGYELSATLRQGAFYTLGFFTKALPALVKSIEAAFSRRADFALHDDLLKRPNHLEYMAGKLETTAADGPLSHREEALRSRIASWLSQTEGWKWAIPRWAAEGLLGSERAFRSFSNTMRADLFDYMKASVDASRPGTWSEDDAKILGSASNIFSGRAPMQHSVAWGRVLYAPRWVWSRALLAVGQPAWKGDKATRLAVGKVYVRAALGMAAFQAIKHLIYLLSADDDDDKPKYELDMRSSDFGKMRIGDTRLDTGAGVNQLATLAARLATGQTKRQSGEIVDLRGDNVPYGADDTVDVMSRFLRTKLAPLPSGVIDWIAGENVVGEKSTVSKIIGDRLTPMTWGDIWDAEKALNVPQGTVAAIEAFLGTGVSTYGDKTKYRSASNEERTKILEKDLKNFDWDSPAPAYAEFLTEDQLKQFDDRKHYRFGSKVNDATGKPESESSIKARDEAKAIIKSSGWTFDESKKAMIDYWEATNTTKNSKGQEVKGKAKEIKNGNSVYKDAVQKRITILRKIYQTK